MKRTFLNFSNLIPTYLKGVAMGCADIVPGVSGGTMALILGIYPKLVGEIAKLDHTIVKDLLSFKFKKVWSHFDFSFLIPLLFGLLSAIVLGAFSIHWLLAEFPEATWGFFLGLMIASCLVVKKRIERFDRIFFFPALLLSLSIVNLVPFKTPETIPLIFFAGMIAIVAMILPGISGAFLLLVMGKYEQITGAIKEPLAEGHFLILIVFCLGCLVGLISFSKVLKKVLSDYPSQTYSALLGFIIGALYKLWPWKQTIKSEIIRGKEHVIQTNNTLPNIWASYDFLVIVLILLGIFLVVFLENKSTRR